jgi:solute carrier family 36 (proton-coupled amino acid transporter)
MRLDVSCMPNSTIKNKVLAMELRENCNVIINENYRRSTESILNQYHPDVVVMKLSTEKNGHFQNGSSQMEAQQRQLSQPAPSTSYIETLIHLFKGNVGPGCLAMPNATKNGGLLLAPFLTLFLGITCENKINFYSLNFYYFAFIILGVHVQHILLDSSEKMRIALNLKERPDYAETVELCFASSSKTNYRKCAKLMKTVCNSFICVTQLGFCCIYFLFITTNLKQVLDFYGLEVNFYILIVIVLLPIWLASLITNLKYLGKVNIYQCLTGLFMF